MIENPKRKFSTTEANRIISLHNSALDDCVYGDQLMVYLMGLESEGVLDSAQAHILYILSVQWPIDLAIEPIMMTDKFVK